MVHSIKKETEGLKNNHSVSSNYNTGVCQLNERPRKMLAFEAPAEKFNASCIGRLSRQQVADIHKKYKSG